MRLGTDYTIQDVRPSEQLVNVKGRFNMNADFSQVRGFLHRDMVPSHTHRLVVLIWGVTKNCAGRL